MKKPYETAASKSPTGRSKAYTKTGLLETPREDTGYVWKRGAKHNACPVPRTFTGQRPEGVWQGYQAFSCDGEAGSGPSAGRRLILSQPHDPPELVKQPACHFQTVSSNTNGRSLPSAKQGNNAGDGILST